MFGDVWRCAKRTASHVLHFCVGLCSIGSTRPGAASENEDYAGEKEVEEASLYYLC